jgi:predicted RNA-binding protein
MTKNSLAEMMNNFKTVEAVNIDNLTKSEIIKKIEEYEKISSEEHLVLFLPCSAKA